MSDKRRGHRIPVRIQARYRSEIADLEGTIENISRFGMFLCTEFLEAEGTSALLDLSLPGINEPLHLAGHVVRVDQDRTRPGMAIRFAPLSPAAHRTLANFMIEQSYPGKFD